MNLGYNVRRIIKKISSMLPSSYQRIHWPTQQLLVPGNNATQTIRIPRLE